MPLPLRRHSTRKRASSTRCWRLRPSGGGEDFTLGDVAARAGLTLSQFRDHFPSKGAILGAWSRQLDKMVLDGTSDDLIGEPAKERLFDVLMRRLDAMAPHRDALDGIMEWVRRDPAAALALNGVVINSMRFMLEAAGIDSEGPVGAMKLQGLALAWSRGAGRLARGPRSGTERNDGCTRSRARARRKARWARRRSQSRLYAHPRARAGGDASGCTWPAGHRP